VIVYEVGGAVRDALLGRPPGDRDWVVVGATPQQMLDAGFRPVGRDFPVFLHPQTNEEYALARTERKSAPGYHGFVFQAAPEVTLEQDLARRDLTLNAIARAADGTLIDPHGGQRDLAARVLRHVSPAFVDDPVRLLRLARLAARLHDFSVAPETEALLVRMVANGEVDALVPERVWQELARGLMEARPERMFAVLERCGARARLLPELAHPPVTPPDRGPLAVRWAALLLAQGLAPEAARALAERLRVPAHCRDLADLALQTAPAVRQADSLDAQALVALLMRCDALRRPQRLPDLLQACGCDSARRLPLALAAARGVDTARIAAGHPPGPALGQAIQAARVAAVAAALQALEAGGKGPGLPVR
jgi:tRNA nucleotidyltransferase (CCA-adding enzyme)